MAIYYAEILGANASESFAHSTLLRFSAVGAVDEWRPVTVSWVGCNNYKVALFSSKDEARTVARACRWSNQFFRVRAARGKIRATGLLLSGRLLSLAGKVRGCQGSSK